LIEREKIRSEPQRRIMKEWEEIALEKVAVSSAGFLLVPGQKELRHLISLMLVLPGGVCSITGTEFN